MGSIDPLATCFKLIPVDYGVQGNDRPLEDEPFAKIRPYPIIFYSPTPCE